VALPVVLAGALLRKKIVVHESDTHSGLVNRIAARFASQVFTGFDDVLPRAKTVGQILSDNILVDEETPIQIHSKPQVLVVGGSQ
jgi:UDP-N-acetylglucosamine--N-acetylmuramyl-(pentapeptide) pyrophosphoryl-undecaprenol N-acetylglucosamine transferase